MHDYISFYGLRSYGKLFEGGPVAASQVTSTFLILNGVLSYKHLTSAVQANCWCIIVNFDVNMLALTKKLRFIE